MEKLSFSKKLWFGMGGLSMNLCDLVFMQWLFVRYAPDEAGALVPPALLGALFLSARVFEAIIGPLVGHWSDNCRSRSGRRLPFVRRGLLPLALVFFLLWFPPLGRRHWVNALYVGTMIPAYLFLYNVVITPYLGLLPEISSDLKERVDLTTYQSIFIMVSTLIFGTMGLILARFGWPALALLVTAITVAAMLPVCLWISERYVPRRDVEQLTFLGTLMLCLQSRPFVHIVLSTSCVWFGLNSILLLVPYWVTHFLGMSQDTVTRLMIPMLITNFIFFFVFNHLAKRFGKYAMFIATLIVLGCAFSLLTAVGVFPWGSLLVQSMGVVACMGMAIAGFSVIPFAMLADAVDYDEQVTGRRREAIFFGFQGTFQKVALGLSTFEFGLLAYLGGEQVSVLGLKLVAVAAGLACFLGILLFAGYPLREHGTEIAWVGRPVHPLPAVEGEVGNVARG